jgi:hypothetical protein
VTRETESARGITPDGADVNHTIPKFDECATNCSLVSVDITGRSERLRAALWESPSLPDNAE